MYVAGDVESKVIYRGEVRAGRHVESLVRVPASYSAEGNTVSVHLLRGKWWHAVVARMGAHDDPRHFLTLRGYVCSFEIRPKPFQEL